MNALGMLECLESEQGIGHLARFILLPKSVIHPHHNDKVVPEKVPWPKKRKSLQYSAQE